MLDIGYIRENAEKVKKASVDKNIPVDVDRILELDSAIRDRIPAVESLRSERNRLSKSVPALSGSEKDNTVSQVRSLKEALLSSETVLKAMKDEYDSLMLSVPNVPDSSVPFGRSDNDNIEIKKHGTPRSFDFQPKDHLELMENLDLADIPRGVKVSGGHFYYLKNEAMLMESALLRYALDKLVSKGFTPLSVPMLVKEHAMYGTGYFPLGRDQAYKIPEDKLFLAGTSEVSLISYHQDELLPAESLPKLYAGWSSCFRREAGTYGRDTRGLYRVHQFQKVEQAVICRNTADDAEKMHEFILGNTEEMLQELGLPYRIVLVCTGEMGMGQVYKHDIETWMPGRNAYCETHSCSTMGDFQARRLNIRYKDEDGGNKYACTLNNTAIASPRILIPILENYQNRDGTITVPEVLRQYMGGICRICLAG